MKNILLLIALTFVFGASTNSTALAQDNNARQLYLGYATNDKLQPVAANADKTNSTTKGRPGAKLVIERMRNGKLAFVSPNSKFRSGDKIRLRLQTNFAGHLAIMNVGSTGAVDLLFPYAGADSRITPSTDFQVPKADAWIVFDKNPGVETVTVIMSRQTLRAATEQERRDLSSQAAIDSRDLYIETGDQATYAVCPEQQLDKPIGFTLRLKHQK